MCCSPWGQKVGHSRVTELTEMIVEFGKFTISNENFSALNYNIEGTILVLFHDFATKPIVKIRLLD